MTARADQLPLSTVKIEALGSNGSSSIGTGFFMVLNEHEIYGATVVVTNRHVVKGANTLKFTLNCRIPSTQALQIGAHKEVVLSHAQDRCLFHPNSGTDLAAFPIADVIDEIRECGEEAYFRAFSIGELADQAKLDASLAVTKVATIGYPIEHRDHQGDFPIIRHGTTASLPNVRLDGTSQFIIDCTWLPGCSGSPVVLFNSPNCMEGFDTTMDNGPSALLLGVLSGPIYDPQRPTTSHPIPRTSPKGSSTPASLGKCVWAEEIHWFDEYIRRVASSPTQRKVVANSGDIAHRTQ